ncbi:MAG TPA: hypothetical protein VIB78_11105 [Acidimicrobiia bacterium]|jgi:hypothetical protein
MTYRRAFVLFLVLSMLTVACGGSGGQAADEDSESSSEAQGQGDSEASDEAESESAVGGVDLSDTGTVNFRIGGNVDEVEDTWYFFPAASAFIDGNWALTFTPNADGSGEGLLTISLQAEDNYISYATTDLTLATTTDTCEVEVDHKGSDGAAGSFSCADAVGFRASGATVDGVTITGSFDARA